MDIQAYGAVKERLTAVLASADGDEVITACPAWTVRDMVAHLVGLCEDWVDHRLDGYGSPAWTGAQVSPFPSWPIDAIVERWDAVWPVFATLPDDPVMGPPARWAFGDAVVHEADIRGSLGAGRVPAEAVPLALKGSIGRWRQVLRAAGAPTVLLRAAGPVTD